MILLNAQLDTISLNDNIKWNFSHTDIIINKHTQTYYIVKPVLRIPGKTNLTARDVTATYEPQIHYFERDLTDAILLENIKVYNLKRIIDPKQGGVGLIWKASLLFQTQRLYWPGTMQALFMKKVEYSGKFQRIAVPIIDLDPLDYVFIQH